MDNVMYDKEDLLKYNKNGEYYQVKIYTVPLTINGDTLSLQL